MTPEEREDIGIFRAKVADLRRRPLLQAGEPLTLQVTPAVPTGLTGIMEDELRAVLALLRQFELNDPTNLRWVIRVLNRECERSDLRRWAAYAWGGWVRTLDSRPLGLGYTVREAMDLLLNTTVVHADRAKSRRLRPDDTITHGFLREVVTVSLDRLCHAPQTLDRVLWHWLDAPSEPVPEVPAIR